MSQSSSRTPLVLVVSLWISVARNLHLACALIVRDVHD